MNRLYNCTIRECVYTGNYRRNLTHTQVVKMTNNLVEQLCASRMQKSLILNSQKIQLRPRAEQEICIHYSPRWAVTEVASRLMTLQLIDPGSPNIFFSLLLHKAKVVINVLSWILSKLILICCDIFYFTWIYLPSQNRRGMSFKYQILIVIIKFTVSKSTILYTKNKLRFHLASDTSIQFIKQRNEIGKRS